ncbi:hypothetical protein COB28_04890 [Candidatus Dependentiae bacterium]|nr:MAG: hypothetical protein COB28_04890 [Candidatus Dependentiae bacterium]
MNNKQSKKTQAWQNNYFISFNEDKEVVRKKIKLLMNEK